MCLRVYVLVKPLRGQVEKDTAFNSVQKYDFRVQNAYISRSRTDFYEIISIQDANMEVGPNLQRHHSLSMKKQSVYDI